MIAVIEAGRGEAEAGKLGPAERALVEDNIPLARWVADRMDRLRIDQETRRSEAYFALCRAAIRHGKGGVKNFAAYATRVVREHLEDVNREQGGPIRIPPRTVRGLVKRGTPGRAGAAVDRVVSGVRSLSGDCNPADEGASPLEQAAAVEEQSRLTAAIDRLPAAQREAILDRLAGLSQAQSAARQGATEVAIRNRRNRAIAKLRAELTGGKGEGDE